MGSVRDTRQYSTVDISNNGGAVKLTWLLTRNGIVNTLI